MSDQPTPTGASRILGIPLPLIDRARQHQESLEREFRLIALRPDDTSHVTARLLALVAELEDRFGSFSRTQSAQLDAALTRGGATVDLEFLVPEAAQAASWRLGDLLDEADEYCRDGELLTPRDTGRLRRAAALVPRGVRHADRGCATDRVGPTWTQHRGLVARIRSTRWEPRRRSR